MVRHLVQSCHVRRDDLANRAWVDLTVGVAAHPGIHRAVIHAGAAADAVQGLAHLGIGKSAGAAVIQQHQVHLFRTIQLVGLAGAGNQVHVGGNGLAKGRAGQQGHQGHHVPQVRNHFFNACYRNVHGRRRRAHAPVAFVFHQQQGAGFGDGEVHAGNTHIRFHEFPTQGPATNLDQLVNVFGLRLAQFVVEQLGHLPRVLVDRWHNDVGGLFVVELNNVFPHVGFQAFDAPLRQVVVHLHFFADHGLAFHHLAALAGFDDAMHQAVGFLDGLRPVNLDAVLRQLLFKLLQQIRQTGKGTGLDPVTQFPQAFTLVGIWKGVGPLGHQRVHGHTEIVAQLTVRKGLFGAAPEVRGQLGNRNTLTHATSPAL